MPSENVARVRSGKTEETGRWWWQSKCALDRPLEMDTLVDSVGSQWTGDWTGIGHTAVQLTRPDVPPHPSQVFEQLKYLNILCGALVLGQTAV